MTDEKYEPMPGFVEVAALETLDGYNWQLVSVLRRSEDGRFVYYTDNGCSCTNPYEDAEPGDFIELDSPDSPAFLNDVQSYGGDAGENLEFMGRVRAAMRAV